MNVVKVQKGMRISIPFEFLFHEGDCFIAKKKDENTIILTKVVETE